jgi:hypothetical protein
MVVVDGERAERRRQRDDDDPAEILHAFILPGQAGG